ncbi:bifunctional folylpolyglutamate synthase/dihydrofolate synthase [Aureispira anguillae]|uniref:Dihydrofolate synthase/folylpolyglutamate synthase n=1 Tax=Aureispira anguillae TaxID=2864201 RepID=A0A915YIC7_9BACT|nr:folylpolyglutamate synthase/dihydrofolate synthase family protein [Aureispira anguillae]BDS13428.1 bifunctional folylpolyglutamate synthase/dihydrofolate synthase [Aureispira anguillae]
MNYQATIQYLFRQLPMFQRVGKQAFKKDLGNIIALCDHLGQPQQNFKSVHIAGTNGKGSTAHILAAILQTAGYKVGLYTSPHYRDFRERIKINGTYITEQAVVDFVADNKSYFEALKPSFFEMTVAMAFNYFSQEKVDIAIIETGLGGRLDSTNIIQPLLSIITNIGMDHEAMLGNTLPLIATEKAGIIKPNTPVLIGETNSETAPVFLQKAKQENSPITFVDQVIKAELVALNQQKATYAISSASYKLNIEQLHLDLTGNYQQHNLKNALLASQFLANHQFNISPEHIQKACANVQGISKILGRWQVLSQAPLTICDSGHNEHGLKYIAQALNDLKKQQIHFVFGTVNDKDLEKVFPLLPQQAIYYFCKANVPRGLDAQKLQQSAKKYGLAGDHYPSVAEAFAHAQKQAKAEDCVFIGGSIFVVAEVV